MSIPRSNETGFCSDRCEREFGHNFSLGRNVNEKGAFNLIAAVIADMFFKIKRHDDKEIEQNKKWIMSPACVLWCDCSDNFSAENLLKNYENKVREYRQNK